MRGVADLLRKSADCLSIPEDRKPCLALGASPGRRNVVPGSECDREQGHHDAATLLGDPKRPRTWLGLGFRVLRRFFNLLGGREEARACSEGGGTPPGWLGARLGGLGWYGGLLGAFAPAKLIRRCATAADTGLERRNDRRPHHLHRPNEGQQEQGEKTDDRAHSDSFRRNQPLQARWGFLEFD